MHWNRCEREGRMIWNGGWALALALGLTACASRPGAEPSQNFPTGKSPKSTSAPAVTSATTAAPKALPAPDAGPTIVTPSSARVGRISLVNGSARYVIVTYAVGELPSRDSRLYVFRDGLKVAELKVTDFSRDINAAADIEAGDCKVGDEVREP